MPAPIIKRAHVWPGTVRAAHWIMALAVLVLIATGWVLGSALYGDTDALIEAHLTAGYVLAGALGLRAYRLFAGHGAERWRDLVPNALQAGAAGRTLRFYLTGTRSALPAYYAHNPLWGPLHLLVLIVLLAQCAAGIVMHLGYYRDVLATTAPWIFSLPLPEAHRMAAAVISAYAAAHVLAVFLHDWKGNGTEVSAMISGTKYFVVEGEALRVPEPVQRDGRVEDRED
jgi:Ni/Fe-hydrogenase 1 B-type cytochrome subunit